MNTTSTALHTAALTTVATPLQARLSSLGMAAVLTLAMLAGVNTLAVGDGQVAPQLAQSSTPRA